MAAVVVVVALAPAEPEQVAQVALELAERVAPLVAQERAEPVPAEPGAREQVVAVPVVGPPIPITPYRRQARRTNRISAIPISPPD